MRHSFRRKSLSFRPKRGNQPRWVAAEPLEGHFNPMDARQSVLSREPRRFADRRTLVERWRVAFAVAIIHTLVAWALVRALGASTFAEPAASFAIRAYNVVETPSQPPPRPVAARRSGAAAPAAKEALPSAIVVPPKAAMVPQTPVTAPVPSAGQAPSAGAASAGAGSGAGGTGAGTGAGNGGNGNGGGLVRKPVQIAGAISSTRDYPPDRDLHRIGLSVMIAFTVRTDGRISDCRVLHPSGDDEADAITCRLALERFRFRPATNAAGDPVESRYGWKQSWFRPGER